MDAHAEGRIGLPGGALASGERVQTRGSASPVTRWPTRAAWVLPGVSGTACRGTSTSATSKGARRTNCASQASGGTLDEFCFHECYRYLNCGCRVVAVGGTDRMTAGMPVGGVRTYARLDPNLGFSFEN